MPVTQNQIVNRKNATKSVCPTLKTGQQTRPNSLPNNEKQLQPLKMMEQTHFPLNALTHNPLHEMKATCPAIRDMSHSEFWRKRSACQGRGRSACQFANSPIIVPEKSSNFF